MNMGKRRDDFDGYAVEVVLDEDGQWLAHFAERPEVSAFANTPERALAELRDGWAVVKAAYVADGQSVPLAPARKRYSGQFNVRIDRRIHQALAIEAARAGLTLNALVAQKLARAVYPEDAR
jgi:predicted HicB family RNase H-like nuclease